MHVVFMNCDVIMQIYAFCVMFWIISPVILRKHIQNYVQIVNVLKYESYKRELRTKYDRL